MTAAACGHWVTVIVAAELRVVTFCYSMQQVNATVPLISAAASMLYDSSNMIPSQALTHPKLVLVLSCSLLVVVYQITCSLLIFCGTADPVMCTELSIKQSCCECRATMRVRPLWMPWQIPDGQNTYSWQPTSPQPPTLLRRSHPLPVHCSTMNLLHSLHALQAGTTVQLSECALSEGQH